MSEAESIQSQETTPEQKAAPVAETNASGRRKHKEEITPVEGVTVTVDKGNITIKGEKGELVEVVNDPKIKVSFDNGKIILQSTTFSRHEKRKIKTFRSHIMNKMQGVLEGYVYKLKICAGHFPMNVTLQGQDFVIKNFLGEKIPRTLKIVEGGTVKIEGEIITVESVDKEIAGQIAASIEKLCTVTNRDLRVFQDGIYITEKAGKEIK
jgi:large subunit ribosomal protein L6